VLDYWTGDLAGLHHHGKLIDQDVAAADAEAIKPVSPAPKPYAGYLIVALLTDPTGEEVFYYKQDTDRKNGKVHNSSTFAFCAFPAEYGKPHRMTYLVTATRTIVKRDNGGQKVLHWPSGKGADAAWVKAE
jgi:hypothetical protein